ncbi:MAG TPA: ATP dependent DNA ligase [Candidatus Hypogeohydataceae bacterium YC41]
MNKEEVRRFVWSYLEDRGIADFPTPCFGRIPNFIGSEKATERLLSLEEFRHARCVFSAPDYVLKRARDLVLSQGKTLAFATPDVVVTAAEYGHGKRKGLLSDYTFAVRDGERLVNIGKAYSGLTDQEIEHLTNFFLKHTIRDMGGLRFVEPLVVLEVAFQGIQKSQRHESGYVLRFPRIQSLRNDKNVCEIDTLDYVRRLYNLQKIKSTA